jgi:hypothetical protein
MDNNEICAITIGKPIWASGLEDASWLFPAIKREKRIAVWGFSITRLNIEEKEGESKEDDIGKASRFIPLYIMERLFIESDLESSNYIVYKKKVGPVVSAVRYTGKEISDTLEKKYDYLITGTIQKDYLNSQIIITIFLYNQKSDTEKIIIEHKIEGKSCEESGIEAANLAIDKIITISGCNKSDDLIAFYKRPKESIAPQYLSGLAQLLAQSSIQNEIVTKEGLCGEDLMLGWYKSLMEDDIYNDCAKLMYLKGIIASIDYGGTAYIAHINCIKEYIQSFLDVNPNDFMVSLSPVIFKKINDKDFYDKVYCVLKNKKTNGYEQWLDKVNQMKFSDLVFKNDENKNVELDILYALMKENSKRPNIYPLFHKKLFDSKIYFLTFSDKPLEKEEKHTMQVGDTMSVRVYPDGTIPIFSSKNRMLDNNSPIKTKPDTYGAIVGRDFFNTCRGTRFFLNPYSDIVKELALTEIDSAILTESICKYCKTNKNIKLVYLVHVQKDEVVLSIDCEEDIHSVLADLGVKCPPPKSLKISVADYNEKTKDWLKDVEPIYIREKN